MNERRWINAVDTASLRCYQINDEWADHSWPNWFAVSLEAFAEDAPSLDPTDYDYVQVITRRSYKEYHLGNDGAQGFRHRDTGWTIPDHCRQTGGCPEIWQRSRRHQMTIAPGSPILAGHICEW